MMRDDKGMTLIELVAAMAVFAVIAVMAVQALSGTLRARDRLVELQSDIAELTRPLALLRQDLSAAAPLAFYPPGGQAPRSPIRMSASGTALEISVAGQTMLVDGNDIQSGTVSRIEWRYDPDEGTLHRRTWRVMDPLNANAADPEVAVMDGVLGLDVQTYWGDGRGWRAGTSGQTGGPSALDGDNTTLAAWFSTQLPDAIALTVQTRRYGPIRIVETFQ